jgi:hypothetical protein
MKHLVPHSECAMSMRIAGKTIVAFRFDFANPNFAEVWVEGQRPFGNPPYRALVSEILPFELRDRNVGFGTIQFINKGDLK